MPGLIEMVLVMFPLIFSPGPGGMFFAANAVRFGFKATVAAQIGYQSATLIAVVAMGLGLSALFDQLPILLLIIKYVGAGYILFLALKFMRRGILKLEEGQPANFWDGFLLLILNPKLYVVAAIVYAQFLNPEFSALAQTVWISSTFLLLGIFTITFWMICNTI